MGIEENGFSNSLVVKAANMRNAELCKEIIQLRDDLSSLASACDDEGEKKMANSVRYILGKSLERGVLG